MSTPEVIAQITADAGDADFGVALAVTPTSEMSGVLPALQQLADRCAQLAALVAALDARLTTLEGE